MLFKYTGKKKLNKLEINTKMNVDRIVIQLKKINK